MWCGGGPSLERLGCCKYPRRWLWLCGFWVSDDSSLRWHRSDAIKGFFRPQFALAAALTWSMRLDTRLFHTVARLHSFVRCCFGLWWKNILPLLKLRLIHMSETTIRTLCDVFMMSVKCGFVCSLQHINQQILWRSSLLGKLKYSDDLGQDLLHYYLNAIEYVCCIKNKDSRRRSIEEPFLVPQGSS